jgi:hypothetical protein
MIRISVEYQACYRRWTVVGMSDSRLVARLRLAGNQNAGVLVTA